MEAAAVDAVCEALAAHAPESRLKAALNASPAAFLTRWARFIDDTLLTKFDELSGSQPMLAHVLRRVRSEQKDGATASVRNRQGYVILHDTGDDWR